MRAKEIKGALCLNNANTYGGSWRTPAIDLAFQNKHGGETAQRFYSKFPIYRPRGSKPPDVTDDIQKIWDNQISLKPTDGRASPTNKLNTLFGMRSEHAMNDELWKTTRVKRSTSNFVGTSKKEAQPIRTHGQNFIYPVRKRFNEDTNSVI